MKPINSKDYNKISKGAAGAGGMVTSAVQAGVRMGELPDTGEPQEAIDDLYSRYLTSSSMSDLQNLFDSTNFAKTNYNYKDILGMSSGEAAGNIAMETVSQGAQGAQTGALIGGGWGALAGGLIGLIGGAVSSGFGWLARKNKAKREAKRLNGEGIIANEVFMDNFNNSVDNAMTSNRNQSLLNIAALGGPLDTTFTNGVRFITEGGSHSQNPIGGIPQGIASDGIPNLVEEGEVIYDDYVYSKRLKVPQSDKESLGLKKDKEYTYADAAKQIQKESEERPNDPISKRNLAEMMSRLQGSQETLKEKRDGQALKRAVNNMTPDELAMFVQQLQQPQQMQPMMAMQNMQPMQPTQSEVPMFAKGGLLGHRFDLGGFSVDAAGNLIYDINANSDWGNIYNTLNSDEKAVVDAKIKNAVLANNEELMDDTLSPYVQQTVDGASTIYGIGPDAFQIENIAKPYRGYNTLEEHEAAEQAAADMGHSNLTATGNPRRTNSNFNFTPSSAAQALRAAPVFGSAMGAIASLFDKPNYSNIARAERAMASVPRVAAGTIGQRLTYNPVDINYIANAMNNQAIGTRRAIMEGSLGNAAAAAGQLAALNYTSQTALGNALMQAARENDAKKAQVATFNRETDSTNVSNALQAALANQQRDMTAADFLMRTGQLRDAELGRVQANRNTNLTNLFNNLGNLGTDMLNRDMAMAMAQSYGVTYNPYMDALMRTYGYRGAKGGKLNTKKGGKDA